MIDSITQPGKLPVATKKIRNKENIIRKFRNADAETIIGKHIFGKFIFFKIFELLMNTLTKFVKVSEKSPHVKTPEQRYMLYAYCPPPPENFALINSENISVYTDIIAIGCKTNHAAPKKLV